MSKVLDKYGMRYPITYSGRYYSITNAPCDVDDKEQCAIDLNEISERNYYGVMMSKEGQLLWHDDMWRIYSREHNALYQ